MCIRDRSQSAQPDVETSASEDAESEEGDISLEEVSESENQGSDVNTDDSDASNS